MASQAKELPITDPDAVETWIRMFEATVRHKKLKDSQEMKEITDYFLSIAGMEAIRKVSIMCMPRMIEELLFVEIKTIILDNMQPRKKIIIAERSKFMQIMQEKNESVQNYVNRLRDKARYCGFNELNTEAAPQSAEDDLIQMKLIDGLASQEHKAKVIEFVQIYSNNNMTLTKCVEFIQQVEVINNFAKTEIDDSASKIKTGISNEQSLDINYQIKSYNGSNAIKCKYCNLKHPPRKCPAYGKKCTKCGKANHYASVCKSKAQFFVNLNEGVTDTENIWHITTSAYCINSLKVNKQYLTINNKTVPMQVDTGADVSIISSKLWQDIGCPKLEEYNHKLEVYDGHSLNVLGKIHPEIIYNNKNVNCNLVVVKANRNFGLLGCDILKAKEITEFINHNKKDLEILPVIKGYKATMDLVNGAKPMFCRTRPVPIPLQEKVKEELERLEKIGIITPINEGVENASPVVWIRKENDKLRMCVDFKIHVNNKIKTDAYPIPNIETIFAKLKNAKVFAKLDLSSAYWQIELDEKAKDLSIINTSKGLYRINRLQMGMKNSAAIFQRVMESILSDIKGILIYQDDVAIYAANKEQLEKRLEAVKKRLQEKNITLNRDKSIEYTEELSFLGFKISARGIEPDDKLVNRIKQMKYPDNPKEMERFLGLVNFFGRLIPNFSKKVHPLNQLRKSGTTYAWTLECKKAFDGLINEISSKPVIQPYSLEKPIQLITDASKEALAAVLMQEGHPVIFISRTLSKAEANYSNIEREALAVTWAVLRLKQFLLGRFFTICTDHQPLVKLFGNHAIPLEVSARISRWALQLMPFAYEIEYTPGKNIPHVDALTRLKFEPTVNVAPNEENKVGLILNAVNFETSLLDPTKIEAELKLDQLAQRIIKRIKSGKWANCSQSELPFKRMSTLCTIENNLIYVGTNIYIPPRLRKEAIAVAHNETHSGIASTTRRLKLAAWWPGLDADVELAVKACTTCNKIRPNSSKTCSSWPAAKPFERIHMDWAHIKGVGDILIVVDSGSGWIEAFRTNSKETRNVIKCLQTIFTRFGIPQVVVSDNAQEFTSDELNTWLYNNGARKIESPPYYPKANGIAERAVQTVKRALSAWKEIDTHCEFDTFLQKILFHHRIATASHGKSPAEIVFNRPLRVPVVAPFQQGDDVWYKPFKASQVYPATYLMTKGQNSSWIMKDNHLTLVSNNQIFNKICETENIAVRQFLEPHIFTKQSKKHCEGINNKTQENPFNAIVLSADEEESCIKNQSVSELPEETIATDICRKSTRIIKKPHRLGLDD